MSMLDQIRAWAPRRQLLLAALAAVVIGALLVAAYALVLRRPYAVLFANLRTMDAATIVAALEKKKVPYRLEDGGSTIRVPAEQVDSMRLAITSEDLPIKGTVGFELFNKSDMGLTEFAQRINYQRALQGELARTIMTMDSVDTARVHLALAEPTVFRDDRRPSKASVTLVPRGSQHVSPATVRGVQRLVAAAAPDLSPADVSVLDEHGQLLTGEAAAPDPSATPASQQRQAIEQYYAARIRQAVARVYPGWVQVTVTAGPGPSPPAAGLADPALDSWTPTARRFPLMVALGLAAAPDAQAQLEIRAAVAQAIGTTGQLADEVMLSTSGAGEASFPAAPAPAVGAAKGASADIAAPLPARQSPYVFWMSILAPALVLLLTAAFLLHRRSASPRTMSERQRADYARRLQGLLDEGETHAVRRV